MNNIQYKYFLSLLIIVCVTCSELLSNNIKEYYNSDFVRDFKRSWDDHRYSIEHSLAYVMQETIGNDVSNKHIKDRIGFRLTKAYHHNDGPVDIILRNLFLLELPRCWLPDALLSLASNVLSIEATLTKMIIKAEYLIMRNKSDVTDDNLVNLRSPFLYKQAPNIGILGITVDSCMLSGYVIAKIKGGTVHLAHENFSITKCQYTVTIFRKKSGKETKESPYSFKEETHTLGITHYLLMTLRSEILRTLQEILLVHVNSSVLFGHNFSIYETSQELLFNKTADTMTSVIDELNQKMKLLNGSVKLGDYVKTWDYWDSSFYNQHETTATIKLSNMVMNGLDSIYNPRTGGPYKLNTAMIGEQLRFESLQVLGEFTIITHTEVNLNLNFSVELNDFTVNLDINLEAEGIEKAKLDVVGYSDIEFTQPDLMSGPFETFITGYVKNAMTKALVKMILDMLQTPISRLLPVPSSLLSVPISIKNHMESLTSDTDNELGVKWNDTLDYVKTVTKSVVDQEKLQSNVIPIL